MKNVLAFFGAFNPPTAAHLELAEFAFRQTGRDGVVFVPSRSAYIRDSQKKDAVFSDLQRLNMLETLAEGRPWMRICAWELDQAEQPRSYISLCHLREEGYAPSLLLGSDKLPELASGWKFVREIAREFGIVCLARGKDSCHEIIRNDPFLSSISGFITVLETPGELRDISSSAVRETLRELRKLENELARMLPPEIIRLVKNTAMPEGGDTDEV